MGKNRLKKELRTKMKAYLSFGFALLAATAAITNARLLDNHEEEEKSD